MEKFFGSQNKACIVLSLLVLFFVFYGCSSSSKDYWNSGDEVEEGSNEELTESSPFSDNSRIFFTLQAVVKSTDPDTTVHLSSDDIFEFTITDRYTRNKTALAVDSEGKARMVYAQSWGAFDISLILAGDESGKGRGIKTDTLIVIRENDPKELAPQIVVRPRNDSEVKIIENLLIKKGISVGSSMFDKPGS